RPYLKFSIRFEDSEIVGGEPLGMKLGHRQPLHCVCPGLRRNFSCQRNRRHRKREAPPWSRQQSGDTPCSLHRIGIVDEAILVKDDVWIIVPKYFREKILSLLGQFWYASTG